jgi:hypothetical protein
MPKANEGNIYHLVEHAAARLGFPRLELWQEASKALVEKKLPASNLLELIDPKVSAAMTFGDWLRGFGAAIDRGHDPSSFANFLRHIIVRIPNFQNWLSSRTSHNPAARPSERETVRQTLVQMRKEGQSLRGPQKRLAVEVAKRNNHTLGEPNWGQRAIVRHISEWLRDSPTHSRN